MQFLVDQSVSRDVARGLADAGHDTDHVAERGMMSAKDPEILELARIENRVVITQDTDFGTLLAFSRAAAPSVILLRLADGRPAVHLQFLTNHLAGIAADLAVGAIVVFGSRTIRFRRLPLVVKET